MTAGIIATAILFLILVIADQVYNPKG